MRFQHMVYVFVAGILAQAPAFAQKAILIDDSGAAVTSEDAAPKAHIRSTAGRKFFHEDEVSYDSTYSMRSDRRVGLGTEVMGKLGLIGVTAELNFALDDSAQIGFGGGPLYNSFELGWKHVFGGRTIAPYAGVAYSRWYNSSGGGGYISGSTPSFLADKLLTNGQLQTGLFSLNMLAPSAGIQFNMLDGEYVGTSIYAEAMMLVNLQNLQNVVNGCFGATYYF